MSRWTHNICGMCWQRRCDEKDEPHRQAARLRFPNPVKCCFCGAVNSFGAYVREDPKSPALVCEREHPD